MAVEAVSDSEFIHHVTTNEKVVVKYFADWCGSCRLFSPKFRRLSTDDRFSGIAFLDVNAEESPNARKVAGVTNLPYFAIFKSGQLVDGFSGNKEERVVELIEKLN